MNTRPAPEISNEDLRRWVDRVGDATIPLFAAFGFATLILADSDASKFRWPGLMILVLTIASVSLIMSVQGTHQARLFLPTLEDFRAQREGESSSISGEDENSHEYRRARFWGRGTRLTYHAGIVSLLAGLALALAPPGGKGTDYVLRWFASVIAFFVCLLELGVILREWVPRRRRRQGDQPPDH